MIPGYGALSADTGRCPGIWRVICGYEALSPDMDRRPCRPLQCSIPQAGVGCQPAGTSHQPILDITWSPKASTPPPGKTFAVCGQAIADSCGCRIPVSVSLTLSFCSVTSETRQVPVPLPAALSAYPRVLLLVAYAFTERASVTLKER